MVKHISIRIPWNDTNWSGTVCSCPSQNNLCMILKNICDNRNNLREENVKGQNWNELNEEQYHVCLRERGAPINNFRYNIKFKHPYGRHFPN